MPPTLTPGGVLVHDTKELFARRSDYARLPPVSILAVTTRWPVLGVDELGVCRPQAENDGWPQLGGSKQSRGPKTGLSRSFWLRAKQVARDEQRATTAEPGRAS